MKTKFALALLALFAGDIGTFEARHSAYDKLKRRGVLALQNDEKSSVISRFEQFGDHEPVELKEQKAPAQKTVGEQLLEAAPAVVEPEVPEEKEEAPQNKPQEPAIPEDVISEQPTDAGEKETVYLNFEQAELGNVISYMASLKKINLIPDKAVEGRKVSLSIRKPLTIEKAWDIFHTVLDLTGFSIVKAGDVHRIIAKDKKNREPLPAYINVGPDDLPASDEIIRYVGFLENIKTADVIPIIKSMLDAGAVVLDQPDLNAFVINADKSYNIRAALKVVNELDKSGLQETVVVMRLAHANAKEVRDLFKGLIEEKQPTNPLARLLGRQAEGGASYFSPGTKIIAEDRTNSLILLGPKDSVDKIEVFVKEHIDTELKDIDSPLHVYELQYADAKQIAALLKEATVSPESPVGAEAARYGAVHGGVKYFKPMTFHADEVGNRLIVSSIDPRDWLLLKETIENLDKPQPQVAIEALIVLVDTLDDKQLGGVTRNKSAGQLGDRLNFQSPPLPGGQTQFEKAPDSDDNISILGNLLNGLTGGLGSTLLTFGRRNNIWGIFQTLQTMTHASVLAQPFLTITNKYTAKIVIGNEKRVLAQTATTGVQGFETNSANAVLEVKPQINIDGVINLDVEAHLDEFTDPTGNNKTKRKLKSHVSVADGQVLVLGGIVRNKITETTSGTPILKDIPGLGWFFKNKTKSVEKANVLVFLSPTIIKPRTIQGVNPYTRMKLDIAREATDAATHAGRSRDPVHDWFFDPEKRGYSYKIDDFATARYQPVTVDIKNDPYYRATEAPPK